jgi:hypothetical protein
VILRHISVSKKDLRTIVEFLSDFVGAFVPLKLLWRISLPIKERRLVLGAISSSFLIALSGVVTCAIWFSAEDMGPDVQIVFDGVRHLQVGSVPSTLSVLR